MPRESGAFCFWNLRAVPLLSLERAGRLRRFDWGSFRNVAPSRTQQWEDTMKPKHTLAALASLAVIGGGSIAMAQDSNSSANMTFFVTSVGSGKGADLGGVEGADRHCGELARAAGSSGKTWHAYLSTQTVGGPNAVDARDRIGKGPWTNAKGVVIAKSVDDLHSASNNLTKQTALTEKGAIVNGRGDTPNTHDILTGSQPDGRNFPAGDDKTCKNWSSSTDGSAMLGHADRMGLTDDPPAKSWNSSHPSRGCSQDALKGTGGAGLTYCFAVN
jgi:hypothetical protein